MNSEWYEADDAEDIASGLSAILGPRGLNVPPGMIERQVNELFSRLTPADAENFMNSLKDVGKTFQRVTSSKEFKGVVSTAAPIAGAAVGTYFGGPMGTQIGAKLGSAAGQAVTGGGMPTARQARQAVGGAVRGAATGAIQGAAAGAYQGATAAMPSLGTILPALGIAPPLGDPAAGSTAAAQLLSVIQNPALVASLLSLTMGANGAPTVPVGSNGTEVPVGAMVNLARTLLNRTAEDAESILLTTQESTPDYLLDSEGCVTCDPAVPAQRADALLRLLNAESESEADDDGYDDSDGYDGYETADGVEDWESEWIESEWADSDW